jgi:uncharacterized ferritin-like protein (DUF455 family)
MISYFEFAQTILNGPSLEDKLLVGEIDWSEFTPINLPSRPGRGKSISFSEEQLKFPKSARLKEDEKKAVALHSFANHELLAIEMMAAALLVYPHGDDESIRFKKGILVALKDEQKHFNLYVSRLRELGYEFGDFPLNDFFWRQMEKLKTPDQYTAVMALTFEAANLDFAFYYSKIFRGLGDERTANILDIVLEDELSHVAFGSHWMKRWKGERDLWSYYMDSLPWPLTPARSRGIDFNPELRKRANLDSDFLNSLLAYEDNFSITRRNSL